MVDVHSQFRGHEMRIKTRLVHNVLKSFFLFFGLMFFFHSLFQFSLEFFFFLFDFSQISFSLSPVNQAFSVKFFSPVDIVVLVFNAFDVSFFNLFHAQVGKFFANGLSLEFLSGKDSRHFEDFPFAV